MYANQILGFVGLERPDRPREIRTYWELAQPYGCYSHGVANWSNYGSRILTEQDCPRRPPAGGTGARTP